MLSDRLRQWAFERGLRRRSVVTHAPFSRAVYRSLVQRWSVRSRLEIAPFETTTPVASSTRLFFRHDIDYADCVKYGPDMLGIHLDTKVALSIFIRVDAEAYAPASARELVGMASKAGVLVGLHTSCYVHEDYLAALQRERRVFEDSFGFAPKAFTVHGLGSLHLDRRTAFTQHATEHLEELGFLYSDCTATLRPYSHVFQDCDVDPISGQRSLYSDFLSPPLLPARRRNFLVLAHPCYWTKP